MKKKQKNREKASAQSAGNARLTARNTRNYAVLLTVFFFSGVCGLMYEVVWSRLLTLVFGSTTYAISTVLAVFMLGLAVGSSLMGKSIPAIRNHQRLYGWFEIAIGGYAFLFLPMLFLIQRIHSFAFPYLYNSFVFLNIFRIVLCCAVILLPTVLMGATVPLVGHILTRSIRSIGTDVGLLYSLNTLGAALGSFVSAFLIIPVMGLHWVFYIGGILNVIVGIVAIQSNSADSRVPGSDRTDLKIASAEKNATQPFVALIAFGLLGFLSMTYENAWSRALVLVFGTSIYAFATMLTTYLLGLGFGSILICRFVDRIRRPFLLYGVFTVAIGLSIFVTTPIIGRLPDYFMHIFSRNDVTWHQVTGTEFLVCFLIMLTPTLASGASFPLVSRLFAQQRQFQVGRIVADVYTVNTTGCILGSLAAGFVLIPFLGAEKSLLLGGASSMIIGAVLLYVSAPNAGIYRRFALPAFLIVFSVAGYWKLPSWDQKVMSSGVYVYSRLMATGSPSPVEASLAQYTLLFYREGPSETVTVWESPEKTRFFRVNGKTDGSDGADNYVQTLLGLLPLMYSPDPKSALVIGLGTGITAGSLLDFPGTSLDVIEISPAVVEASSFFIKTNKNVLASPRTHLYVLDGRTWLMSMPKQYDIITSEPSHPWQTGNANLFTVEFFRAARTRLRENGVFCQWLPYYGMERGHFKLLLKSFQSVFPYVNVWVANADALLIGSTAPLALDYVETSKRLAMETIRDGFRTIGIGSMEDLLSFFYLDSDAVRGYVDGVEGFNTDEYPIVEFHAPKYLLEKANPDVFVDLLTLSYDSRLPLTRYESVGQMHRTSVVQRAKYYEKWYIPSAIIEYMVQRASGYPFK